jgi:outer membrane receptor for ferrienterochelin and colicin
MTCALPTRVQAQVSTALVQGQVSDDTGGFLPGVAVVAQNEETGLLRNTITDERGWYRISGLQPGRYSLRFELQGFATTRREALPLTIGQEATIHVRLQLVSVQETVTVTGESPLVEVSNTTLGTTITTKELDDLPLAGRDYLTLMKLAPGVTADGGAAGLVSFGRNSGRGGYVVDGVSQTRNLFPGARGPLSPDAVQEFQVLTNMFSAEYGKAAGPVVNLLTKSGTNDLRGRLALYSRNDVFDARPALARGKAPFSQQWYVGNLGGPVLRDQLHYFGSFEAQKTDETTVVTAALMPGEYPRTSQTLKYLAKVDWQMGRSHHATFRTSIIPSKTDNGGVSNLNTIERATSTRGNRQDYQSSLTSVLPREVLNELRVMYARERNNIQSLFCADCPAITRPGGNLGKATNVPQVWGENTIQIVDHLSFTKGSHSVKVGTDLTFVDSPLYNNSTSHGSFRFNTDRPFDPGDASTYPVQFDITLGDGYIEIPDKLVAFFVQDSWRVNPKLTLNVGLRYDWQGQWSVSGDKNNFGPRLGFTYDPQGQGTFIIRGGGGMFYDQNRLELIYGVLLQERSRTQVRIINPGYPDPYGANPNGSRAGALPLPTRTIVQEDKVIPYSERATLGFVKALTSTMRLSVDGVWVRGLKLARNRDINYPDPVTGRRPDAAFNTITQQESAGRSFYYGLETELEQRLSRNLQFTVAYTWSRTRHDLNDPISHLDFAEAMARDGNPHVLSASAAQQLPFGLQLSVLFRARSGDYYSILTGADNNGDSTFNDRPAGAGRNAEQAPAVWSADARLTKAIALAGARRLELIAEAYNVTNRANYGVPENRLNSASFGRFIQMADDYNPRQIQLGARFSF